MFVKNPFIIQQGKHAIEDYELSYQYSLKTKPPNDALIFCWIVGWGLWGWGAIV